MLYDSKQRFFTKPSNEINKVVKKILFRVLKYFYMSGLRVFSQKIYIVPSHHDII